MFCVIGPESIVNFESGTGDDAVPVGQYVFFPQKVLRYQTPKRSYLKLRQDERDLILTEQRLVRQRATHQRLQNEIDDLENESGTNGGRDSRTVEATLNQLCWLINEGDMPVPEICKLKFFTTKALEFCASEAMQILGGAGYLRGNRIERIYREVKVFAIGGGSEEIMRDLAVRQMGL